MKECIICDSYNDSKSIEHIVPESFGNKKYVMKKGDVCDACNARFSKFEGKALSNTIFVMERARFAVATKKGKPVNGKIGDLKISGNSNFRKQQVSIEGLNKSSVLGHDTRTGTYSIKIEGFDKSEAATSRFLLMLGIESIYKSRNDIFVQYDFQDLKEYLNNRTNNDWGFIQNERNPLNFINIPQKPMREYLQKIHCHLKFNHDYEDELLFHFKFGSVGMTINLLSRNLEWVDDYKDKYDHINILPSHLETKYQNYRDR